MPVMNDARAGRTPLWNAAFSGDLASVSALLAAGEDPNAADREGITPLAIAVQEKHAGVVALLLDHGADPNKPDRHGNVPLWVACHHCGQHREVFTLLLDHGADPHIANAAGRAPYAVLAPLSDALGERIRRQFAPTNSTKADAP